MAALAGKVAAISQCNPVDERIWLLSQHRAQHVPGIEKELFP